MALWETQPIVKSCKISKIDYYRLMATFFLSFMWHNNRYKYGDDTGTNKTLELWGNDCGSLDIRN
jgi:hypothetical protein